LFKKKTRELRASFFGEASKNSDASSFFAEASKISDAFSFGVTIGLEFFGNVQKISLPYGSISKSVGILVLIRVKNISRKALMYKIFFERLHVLFEPFDLLVVKLNCCCSILCLRY